MWSSIYLRLDFTNIRFHHKVFEPLPMYSHHIISWRIYGLNATRLHQSYQSSRSLLYFPRLHRPQSRVIFYYYCCHFPFKRLWQSSPGAPSMYQPSRTVHWINDCLAKGSDRLPPFYWLSYCRTRHGAETSPANPLLALRVHLSTTSSDLAISSKILLCRQPGLFSAILGILASFSKRKRHDLQWSPYLALDRERRDRYRILLVKVATWPGFCSSHPRSTPYTRLISLPPCGTSHGSYKDSGQSRIRAWSLRYRSNSAPHCLLSLFWLLHWVKVLA